MTGRRPYLPQRDVPPDGLDLYETPACAVRALLAVEQVPRLVWEPACGRMAITAVLERAGHDVLSSDVRLRRGGRAVRGTRLRADFFAATPPPGSRRRAIVTNPPFSRADEFVRRAVERSRYVAMLLRLGYLEGGVGTKPTARMRADVLDVYPPTRVIVFSRRLPMMHRDGWTGRTAASGQAFAWFVWDYRGRRASAFEAVETVVTRVDWKNLPAAVATTPRPGKTGGRGGE